MLLSMKTLLDTAKAQDFCIPAPTVWSLETAEAAYETGRRCNTPLILMVWDDNTAEWIEKIGAIVRLVDQKYPDVPCALILDHGQSFASAMAALRAGYTTVMADYSMLPLEENIAAVRRIADATHALGVAVEAELGRVGEGSEYDQTRDAGLTDPTQAADYVRRSGCDMLAVAVGTSHGAYKGEPRIDFERLAELNAAVQVPLVLHGGSGTSDENLRRAAQGGIHKVNLCTDLFNGYEAAVREAAAQPDAVYLSMYFAGPQGYAQMLEHYVDVLGSRGRSRAFASLLAQPEQLERCGGEDFRMTL